MRKRIKQATTALCMSIILLATACGSEQTEVQDESVVETIDKGKIEIEIAHDGRAELDDTLQKIANGFNSSQDFYEVSVRTSDLLETVEKSANSDNSQEQYDASIQELAAPITSSIFFTSDDSAASYAQDARRMDLMSYLGSESGKDSLYSIINSLPANMYETVCDEDSGVFYLPVSVTPPIFFYNKTVYDGMGLSLPQSYSQLRENCLSIYARYRTPGYLPYDLEGDIIAMMREQEDIIHSIAVNQSGAETSTEEAGQTTAGSTSTTAEANQTTASTAQGTTGAGTTTTGQTATGQTTTGTEDATSGADTAATAVTPAMTKGEVLQFFAGSCEAGYFRMVKHESYAARDFSTGAVASFVGTPADREMATTDVTFEVGMLPWTMDREDAVYWVDTSGMLFLDQGDEKNAGAAAFAAYLLRSDVCSEYLESVGGISPYASVYESQDYRKNRRGFDELTKAAEEKMPQADFVLLSNDKRRELDELLLYILDKKVTAEDAVKILEPHPTSLLQGE